VNIYTDSKHAFATLHVHGAIYKERGPMTAGGKEIKNKEEILQLLEAVREPSQVDIIHCRGHQRAQTMSIEETAWLTRQVREQQKN
jgi:ribonuclease HI